MRQHPDMILTYMWEPHRKFVERIHRDYLVHGAVAFYEVGEMLTRADRIVQTSGFSKTSDDLLRVVQSDNKVAIASDSDVMDRLHAFFIALEYLNICDFTIAAGPLKYLSELEEWRHENRGLAVLLAADSLIRKEVYKLNNDKRKEFPSFSLALQEVLTHHKQLWNDARSTAELEKFRQADHEASTPTKRPRSRSPPSVPTPPKSETRSRKNKARRERNKALLVTRRKRSRSQRAVPRSSSPRRSNVINACRRRSGRRSCPSPTLALAGAPSTTAHLDVGLVINAATSIYAFSAGAITPGTTIIERPCDRRGTLVWIQRRQPLTDRRGISPHRRPLFSRLLRRMTLALSSRQPLSAVPLRLGGAGRRSLVTRILSETWVPGVWRSFQVRLDSRLSGAYTDCKFSRRST